MKRVLQFAGKVWGYYAILAVLMLFFSLGVKNLTIRIIADTALTLLFAYLCFAEGGYLGERGVSNAENVKKHEQEGRHVPDEQRANQFSVKFAAVFLAVCLLPFWGVAGLNAACYPAYMEEFNRQQAEAAQMDAAPSGPREGEVVFDENGQQVAEVEEDLGRPRPQHWARLLAWLVFIPFSGISQSLSDGANAALFFAYSLLLPGAAFAGYLCGPRLHKKMIEDMKKGSRRKRRNLLVNKKPKSQRPVV